MADLGAYLINNADDARLVLTNQEVKTNARIIKLLRDPRQQTNGDQLVSPFTGSELIRCLRGDAEVTVQMREPVTRPPPREHARLLIVEDNLINQKVVLGMLEDPGLVADVAGNGREAVECIESTAANYALVLMDCQMPEMDGYEATRSIRSKEKVSGNHLAIIAMTANAMAGDEQRCIDSGMDDYMSKPLDPEVMEEKLTR